MCMWNLGELSSQVWRTDWGLLGVGGGQVGEVFRRRKLPATQAANPGSGHHMGDSNQRALRIRDSLREQTLKVLTTREKIKLHVGLDGNLNLLWQSLCNMLSNHYAVHQKDVLFHQLYQ